MDPSVLQILKDWRQATQFREEEDWMWQSTQIGRLADQLSLVLAQL